MAGILQALQERKDYLKSLREQNPDSYTEILKKGFEKSLFLLKKSRPEEKSRLYSVESGVEQLNKSNYLATQSQIITKNGMEAQTKELGNVRQTIRFTSNSIVDGLKKILLELRKGGRQSDGGGLLGSGDGLLGGKGGKSGKLGRLSAALKGRALPIIGSILGAAYLGRTLLDTETTTEEKAKETTKFVGGTAGAIAGAKAGAVLGSVVPGVGTLAGTLVGSGLGYVSGSYLTEKGQDAVARVSDSIKGTTLGTNIARAAAIAMSPFSDDARKALLADWNTSIIPSFNQVGVSLLDASNSFLTRIHEFTSGVTEFKDSVNLGTKNILGGVKVAWNKAFSQPTTVGKKTNVVESLSNIANNPGKILRSSINNIDLAGKDALHISKGRWSGAEKDLIQSKSTKPGSFSPGKIVDTSTREKITKTAIKYGIPPADMLAIAQLESGGNTNAISPTGAAGLYQFTSRTASKYKLDNRFDADANIDAAARLYLDNKKALVNAGIEPTRDNMYIAHQQGATGAVQIINASNGKGKISEQVAKNMGLNIGGNTTSAKNFLAANSKALAAAHNKVTQNTEPNLIQDKAITITTPSYTQLPEIKSSTIATSPVVATIKSPVVPKVPASVKPEVAKVEVTNTPAETKPTVSQKDKPSIKTTSVPTLAEIPPFFPDISLMPIMMGRYG